MKDVIEQIARIDEIAFENGQANKDLLFEEEKKYLAKIQNYRDDKIMEAHRCAEEDYIKIIEEARAEVSEKTSESAKEIELLKTKFSLVEKDVIEKIFEKLFLIEKEG